MEQSQNEKPGGIAAIFDNLLARWQQSRVTVRAGYIMVLLGYALAYQPEQGVANFWANHWGLPVGALVIMLGLGGLGLLTTYINHGLGAEHRYLFLAPLLLYVVITGIATITPHSATTAPAGSLVTVPLAAVVLYGYLFDILLWHALKVDTYQ